MPGQSCTTSPVIDCGIYGDGDLYQGESESTVEHAAYAEAHAHYISTRIRYLAQLVPGASESFRILRMALRLATDRQASFTHEAFLDTVEATEQMAVVVRHTG